MTPLRTSTARWQLTAVIAFVLAMLSAALFPTPSKAASASGGVELLEYEDDWAETSGGTTVKRAAKAIGADDYWGAGYDGTGVDVALIDSGVLPVDALDDPGKVIGRICGEEFNPVQAAIAA